MALLTTFRTFCDRCDVAGEDVYSHAIEIGGGRIRRRVEFDACEACEAKTPLAKWETLGRTRHVRNGRAAGRYVGVPYGDDDPSAARRNAVRRHVYLRDAVAAFAHAREEMGISKATQRAEARLLDRLLLVNGNIYVRDLGARQMERMFADKTPSEAEVARLDLFIIWCRRNRWLNVTEDLLLPYRSTAARRRQDPFAEVVAGTCLRCRRAGWVTPMVLDGEERVRFTLCRRCRRNVTLPGVYDLVSRA